MVVLLPDLQNDLHENSVKLGGIYLPQFSPKRNQFMVIAIILPKIQTYFVLI
jgi:hypothetical protein